MLRSVLFIVQFVPKQANREIQNAQLFILYLPIFVFLQLNNMTSQSNHLKVLTNIFCSYSLARLLCALLVRSTLNLFRVVESISMVSAGTL